MSNTVNNYTETDLGNISLNPRGEYDNSAAYEYLDAVSYQGGSYFCLAELETTITGIAPDSGHNSEHWQMIAVPGDMTPEYTAAYNDVINKATQVETSRAAVELAQQEIEAARTDVQQLHSDTVQAAQEAENSKNSAANSAQSAEQSRKTVSESEQNINGQIAGFDSRVSEAVEQSKEEINTTKQQAINTITNQQDASVNIVKTEGEKIITRVGNDAKTVADDRATVEEATQTVLNNAQEVAQNTQTVASNTENAAASAESAKTSADNAAQSAKSVEDASKQIEQNKKDVTSLKEDLNNLIGSNIVFDYNSFNLLGDYVTNRKYDTDKHTMISDKISSISIAKVKPETKYFYFVVNGDSERKYYADTIFLDENLSYIDADKNILELHVSRLAYFKMYTTPTNCAYVLQRSRTVDRHLTVLYERINDMMSIQNIDSVDVGTTWKKPTVRIFNETQLEVFKKTENIRSCVANERVYPPIYPDMKYDNEGNIEVNDKITCITPILPICPNTTYKRSAVRGINGFNLEFDINKNLIKTYQVIGMDENYQTTFKTSNHTAYIAFCESMIYFTDEGTTLLFYPTETKTVIVGDETSEFVDKRLEEYSEEIQESIDGINANFNYIVDLTSNGIQTAIDECVNRGGGVVQLVPNATYICTNTINVYSDMVDIIGNGAKLDFSENQDNIGIHIRASGKVTDLHEIFRQQATHKITGVYIIGSNRQNNYDDGRIGTAVLLQSDDSARPSMNYAIEHCAISGFHIGVDIQSQAWTNTLYACDISACDIGVNHSYGHENCGERNTLISCNIHTCSLAVSCSHWAGTIECIATSFDYNFKTFKITDKGHIIATNCHIENTKDKDYFFDINNGILIVKNSVFYCNQVTYGLIKVANYGRVILKDNIRESWSMADDNVVGDTVKYVVEWL